ncbi:MAG: hypothetical protein K8T26_19695 [Lentisphaerae bacterium]|nr:hypothetical protein [Lentisphaerota bacterium]
MPVLFPAMTAGVAASAVERLLDAPARDEGLMALGLEIDVGIRSGAIFNEVSWQPIGTRVTADQLLTFRKSLSRSLGEAGYPRVMIKGEGICDKLAASSLWLALAPLMAESDASSAGVWRWIALRVMPDMVLWRWFTGDRKLARHRFCATGNLRCWPMNLWWYAWMCSDPSGNPDDALMHILADTDLRMSILERTGGGYDRAMVQAVIRRVGQESGGRAQLVRGMMKRLTWIRSVRETGVLQDGERASLVESLVTWSRQHYIGQ